MCTDEYKKYLDDNPVFKGQSQAEWNRQQWAEKRKNWGKPSSPANYKVTRHEHIWPKNGGNRLGQSKVTDHFAYEEDGIRVSAMNENAPPPYDWSQQTDKRWSQAWNELEKTSGLTEDSGIYDNWCNLSQDDADAIIDMLDRKSPSPKLGNIWAQEA